MLPLYEKTENELDIRHIRSRHIAPHLHEALECVYVTDGTLEIGIGKELYHMKKGDFVILIWFLFFEADYIERKRFKIGCCRVAVSLRDRITVHRNLFAVKAVFFEYTEAVHRFERNRLIALKS